MQYSQQFGLPRCSVLLLMISLHSSCVTTCNHPAQGHAEYGECPGNTECASNGTSIHHRTPPRTHVYKLVHTYQQFSITNPLAWKERATPRSNPGLGSHMITVMTHPYSYSFPKSLVLKTHIVQY